MIALASITEEGIRDMPGRHKRTIEKSKPASQRANQRRGQHPASAGRELIRRSTQRQSDLPSDYARALKGIKARVQQERLRVVLAANAAMVQLYWDIGRVILGRQRTVGWGAKVIDRLSQDLCRAFPDQRGFSPGNLKYIRAFAAAWPDAEIVQRLVAQLPWRQNIALLEHLKRPAERQWYAEQTIRNGWSQAILIVQIRNGAHRRQGRAINNTLPPIGLFFLFKGAAAGIEPAPPCRYSANSHVCRNLRAQGALSVQLRRGGILFLAFLVSSGLKITNDGATLQSPIGVCKRHLAKVTWCARREPRIRVHPRLTAAASLKPSFPRVFRQALDGYHRGGIAAPVSRPPSHVKKSGTLQGGSLHGL